jgi:hypothetical protein
MFRFWFDVASMTAEAQQVMWLRSVKLSKPGKASGREAERMVTEKVYAAQRAGLDLMFGKSPESVLKEYRSKVRSNLRRLSRER